VRVATVIRPVGLKQTEAGSMDALIGIIYMIAQTLSMIVIVWFVIGLLFAFNVVSHSNRFMVELYNSIDRLLSPLLNPIRKILPDTGSIDFSPLVLIMVINAILIILQDVG